MTGSGARIAHYRLVRKLGQGGMGEVYRALDERLGRDVALKLLPPTVADLADSQTRLLREAQAAGQLNHPGIVTVHDVGSWRDRVYLVMELVEGKRVADLIRTRMSPRAALALCAEAAEALAAAHERGILHRDIKPDNIMVMENGRVKVLDFGLAKLREGAAAAALAPADPAEGAAPAGPEADTLYPMPTDPAGATVLADDLPAAASAGGVEPTGTTSSQRSMSPALMPTLASPAPLAMSSPWVSVTVTGSLLGTPAYMSPEQAAGEPVDARSEVYSLGLVLYELLTGKRLLARGSVKDTIAAAIEGTAPPSAVTRALPRPAARVVARALARAPAERFADMAAFATALRAAAADLEPRWRRRLVPAGTVAVLAGGAAALLLVHGSGGGGGGGRGGSAAAPPARELTVDPRSSRPVTGDVGCEDYPTFTPDGREVVFDGLVGGDIELEALSVDTSRTRRLTESPGWDLAPAVSPDGKRVAYVHFAEAGRELRVVGIEGDKAGPPKVLGLCRGFPTWTSDREILYGDDGGRLLRVDPDATPPAPIEVARLPPDHLPLFIDAYPDGEIVLSLRSRATDTSLVPLGRVRRGGGTVELMGVTAGDWAHVRVDREGGGFYYVGVAGGTAKVHWLARGGGTPTVLESSEGVLKGFDIDPIAGRLVFSNCETRSVLGHIRQGGAFESFARLQEWDPAWFGVIDPTSVAFTVMRGGGPQIWRVKTGSGAGEMVIETPSKQPAVSFDGRLLAWVGVDPAESGIHLRALEGGAIQRLTDDPSDETPTFSRDGRMLFFTRSGKAGVRVHVVPLDPPGLAKAVTPTGVASFAVSPTGVELAFIQVTGETSAVRIGPPGGPFRPVPGAGSRSVGMVSFSADGRELLLATQPSELVAVGLGKAGREVPVWSSTYEQLEQLTPAHGKLWALLSTKLGDIYLIDGRFR